MCFTLLLTNVLVSPQKREEGDLSLSRLSQGEDGSVLWVRCGGGCWRAGGGGVPGTGLQERGARGCESKKCDDSFLTAGDPTASSHGQASQSPQKVVSAPGGQK